MTATIYNTVTITGLDSSIKLMMIKYKRLRPRLHRNRYPIFILSFVKINVKYATAVAPFIKNPLTWESV